MGDIFNPSRVFIVHSLVLKTVEKQTKLHTTNQKKKTKKGNSKNIDITWRMLL